MRLSNFILLICYIVVDVSVNFIKLFFFFKQKTAYEVRISDWSSDVCSSDLIEAKSCSGLSAANSQWRNALSSSAWTNATWVSGVGRNVSRQLLVNWTRARRSRRSEEHTSELQSLMRISYAVFCLKKKNKQQTQNMRGENTEQTE